KTSILYFLQQQQQEHPGFIEENLNDLCASVQQTILDILMKKLRKASKELGIRQIAIAGGVSANRGRRRTLQETGDQLGWEVYIPKFEYCTDNAAMIAIVGRYMFEQKQFADQHIAATARWKL